MAFLCQLMEDSSEIFRSISTPRGSFETFQLEVQVLGKDRVEFRNKVICSTNVAMLLSLL